MFALCSYQTEIKLIPYHDKYKPNCCIFNYNTTSIHFKRQYCLLVLTSVVFIMKEIKVSHKWLQSTERRQSK